MPAAPFGEGARNVRWGRVEAVRALPRKSSRIVVNFRVFVTFGRSDLRRIHVGLASGILAGICGVKGENGGSVNAVLRFAEAATNIEDD